MNIVHFSLVFFLPKTITHARKLRYEYKVMTILKELVLTSITSAIEKSQVQTICVLQNDCLVHIACNSSNKQYWQVPDFS